MHLLTLFSKIVNFANNEFEAHCPQLGIYVTAFSQKDVVKKLSHELRNYVEVSDATVINSIREKNKIVHELKLTIAR